MGGRTRPAVADEEFAATPPPVVVVELPPTDVVELLPPVVVVELLPPVVAVELPPVVELDEEPPPVAVELTGELVVAFVAVAFVAVAFVVEFWALATATTTKRRNRETAFMVAVTLFVRMEKLVL